MNEGKMKLRNKILLILSIISIVPVGFLAWDFIELARISSPNYANETHRKEVLAIDITSVMVLIPFILELIIIVFVSIAFFYDYDKKNKMDKVFNILSLFMGGVGIHLIAWIFLRNSKQVESKKRMWLITSSSTLVGAGIVAPAVMFSATNSFTDPFIKDETIYSLNAKAPNVIEIFTDGFDKNDIMSRYKKYNNLNSFNFFSKYVTAGGITHLTLPSLYGDFKKYNPARIWRTNPTIKYFTDLVYGKAWFEAGLDHIKMDKDNFSTRTIINPITISNEPNYGATTIGTSRAIVERDPEVNVVNWSGARDSLIGKWGVGNKAWDYYSYEYAKSHGTTNETALKGSRVLISDMITHAPHVYGENGDLVMNGISSREQQTDRLLIQLNQYFEYLKSRKGTNGVNIFDNSLILIYGDHVNHETKTNEPTEVGNLVRKGESALMVKYPNQTIGTQVDDKIIYSPQIKGIIKDFNRRVTNSDTNYMDYYNDPKFNIRSVPFFFGGDYDKMTYVKYTSNKIEPVNVNSIFSLRNMNLSDILDMESKVVE